MLTTRLMAFLFHSRMTGSQKHVSMVLFLVFLPRPKLVHIIIAADLYTCTHTHIEVISQELLSFHSIEQLREQPLTRARSDSARSEFGAALVIPVRVRNRGTATPKERVELGESSQGRP